MNFNIKNICTIYEADESKVKDQVGANLDNTMGNTDMMSVYDNICPISGEVFAAMKKTAADPKNLKIVASNKGDGEHSLFIEAVEFMTFCEAGNYSVDEAADAIIEEYESDLPGIGASDINIVFPSDAMNKNVLGGENRGVAVKSEWPMQLMSGCRRYGMKCRAGVDKGSI